MKKQLVINNELTSFEKAQIYIHFWDQATQKISVEEQQSEQRVRFFLGLAAAVGGLFTVLFQKDFSITTHAFILISSLSLLFIYGLLTFSRLIWRNQAVEKLNLEISDFSRSIIELDRSLSSHILGSSHPDRKTRGWLIQHLNGSFTQFLYLTEALLAGAIVYLLGIINHFNLYIIQSLVCISIAFVVLILFLWSEYVRDLGE